MSKPVTIELLQDIIAAFNSRDVARIAAHFADDAVFYASRGKDADGAAIRGKETIADYVAKRFDQIPNMSWEPVYDYVADDTRAVSVWIVRGDEVTGEKIEARGVDLWEFRGDKILYKDTYWKIKTA
ncbi:transcriptional regulator [Burkholderia lata]|uniref:Transcriptional regulator n=1 Tax=Burkholderia lata (strain ATCC 17760 / DSM 23089 / LMG 22485 / NCIMB 9086 / R18194 / 383) TaxID=482957 RepID=A0A6P2UTH9_BURL3|nr:nuclear transport factor 2 family protein [Burkholderia lata]VWC77232.1 transcriptional regulator [Burkholderia lata]